MGDENYQEALRHYRGRHRNPATPARRNGIRLEESMPRYAKKLKLHWVIDKSRDVSDIDLYDSDVAADYIRAMIGPAHSEHFIVIVFDCEKKYIGEQVVNIGGLTSTSANLAGIIKAALLSGGQKIIVGHNHPSGNCTPSDADKRTTAMIILICTTLGIDVMDHVVVGDDEYTSFVRDLPELWAIFQQPAILG